MLESHFNKVAGLSPGTLFKLDPGKKCFFSVNFAKYLRTSFLQNTFG